MADPRFHFIELALRALRGNPPARDLARGELMDRLAHADPSLKDDTMEEAVARLERRKLLPARQAAILLGGLSVLLGVLVPVLYKAHEELGQLNLHYGLVGHSARLQREFEDRLTAGMNSDERLFLLANTRDVDVPEVSEWQQSFEKELPGDPAWLEEAILTSESGDPLLRERLAQLGASLEPDNGFWDLVESLNSKRRGPLLEAFAKPRIESHLPARTKRRLEMLGPPLTLADQVEQNHFLFLQRSWPAFFQGHNMIAQSIQAGSSTEWREWAKMWATLGFGLPPGGDAESEMRRLLEFGTTVGVMEFQARQQGLASEEARMKRLDGVMAPLRSPGIPGPVVGVMEPFSSEASSLTRNQADFELSGTFTSADFIPGRLAEHAVFDRYMALSGALLFALFAVLAAFEGWRRLPAPRGLAAGLLPLFKPRDAAWVAGLGIALPLACHIGITRFTPLGCRHLGLMSWDMMPGLQQAAGSFLFSACMLQQTLRWRIAKRAGFLRLRPKLLWTGWAVAAVAALFVPAIGLVIVVPREQEMFLVLGSAMGGMPLLWLIWRAGVTAMQAQEAALEGVLLSRLLVPAYVMAAAVLLLSTPALRMEERHWVARDTLGGPAADGSLMQAIDVRALGRIRAALREASEAP